MRTIEHSYKILDWHENLMEDELPPKWMWAVDHELDVWFEGVENRRKAKYGGSGGDEEVPLMGNDIKPEDL